MEQGMLSTFHEELMKIDLEMKEIQLSCIPNLFSKIPLEIFGELLLEIPACYPNIKAFFPTMPTEQVQIHWTGNSGETLLRQSLAFMKTMVAGYMAITGKKIGNASILDYGCGWGRLIRLLYKYAPIESIYAVDPWDRSIKECEAHGVKANLMLSDWVPYSLPFKRKFDLIFAFSVFTHLSEKTAQIVLKTLKEYIADNGVLVITIRPKEYWHIHNQGILEPEMIQAHDKGGFAFTPQDIPPIDGEITFGDTSISLSYISIHYPQWKVVSIEFNVVDPYQIILFLKPVRLHHRIDNHLD
jgi:SAM-dependent methyltransferase